MKAYIPYILIGATLTFMWLAVSDGFYLNSWPWIVALVALELVVLIVLWLIEKHNTDDKKRELTEQAEIAVAAELETVKGNKLKKELLKRRLVREYVKQHANDICENGQDAEFIEKLRWSIKISVTLLSTPGLIILALIALLYLLVVWVEFIGFGYHLVICCVASILATIALAWKRNYILSPVALLIAVAALCGIFRLGINGFENQSFKLFADAFGMMFCNAEHAKSVHDTSMVELSTMAIGLLIYPWLKKKTLLLWGLFAFVALFTAGFNEVDVTNYEEAFHSACPMVLTMNLWLVRLATIADISVMLNTDPSCTEFVLSTYCAPLLSVLLTVPAFVKAWKWKYSMDENCLNLRKRNTAYYICMGWLVTNVLAIALIWGHYIGIPTYSCHCLQVEEVCHITRAVGISDEAGLGLIECFPLTCSALVSWIIYAVTEQQIQKERLLRAIESFRNSNYRQPLCE